MGRKAFSMVGKFFFPKRCLLCGEVMGFYYDGELCPECSEAYHARLSKPCRACGEVYGKCSCVRLRNLDISRHISLGFYREYDDPVGKLVYRLKREYDRDLQRFFADSLAAKFRENSSRTEDFCVTFPPRIHKSKRKSGFDHAEYLARYTAEALGCTWESIFLRSGGKIQKKLTSDDRMKNAEETFALMEGARVGGRRFILVDDVVTTGATLGTLSKLLYAFGAKEVRTMSLFVTEPKPSKPKESGLWFEE